MLVYADAIGTRFKATQLASKNFVAIGSYLGLPEITANSGKSFWW